MRDSPLKSGTVGSYASAVGMIPAKTILAEASPPGGVSHLPKPSSGTEKGVDPDLFLTVKRKGLGCRERQSRRVWVGDCRQEA